MTTESLVWTSLRGLRGVAGLAVSALLVWSLLWHSRLLVSGVYYSVWRLLWYGEWLPGLLALPLLLAASVVAVRSRGSTAALAVLAAPAPLALGDWTPGLSVFSALALGASLAYAAGALRPGPVALALALDGSSRYILGGVDPVEFPAGSLALAAATLAPALAAALNWDASPAAPWHGALLGFAVAGGGYPVSLVRWAGGAVDDPATAAALYLPALGAAAMSLLSPLAALALAAASLAAAHAVHPWLASLAPAALAVPLRPSPWGAVGAGAAALVFTVAGFLHVAVYTGRYIGVPALEGLYAAPLALALAAALPGAALRAPRVEEKGFRELAAAVLLGAILLAVASQSPLAPGTPGAPGPGVATYNLHQGFTPEGRLNGVELVEVLALLPGTLCLQEVDAGRATSSYMDLPVLLASMGYSVEFQPAIAGHYGVAVAHNGGLERLASGTLPGVDSEDRAWLAVEAGGYTVATVHLGLTPGERLLQVKELFNRLDAAGVEPVILCGDFNEEQGSATMVITERGYVRLEPIEGPGFTCCLGEATRVSIDHVYALEGSEPSHWKAWIVLADASDHLPVAAAPRR